MKERTLKLFRNLKDYLGARKRWLPVVIVALCLIPSTARAVGLGDIISLLKTITSTIQGAIGGPLNEIQNLQSLLNRFRQQTIWPLAAISQARALANAVRARNAARSHH